MTVETVMTGKSEDTDSIESAERDPRDVRTQAVTSTWKVLGEITDMHGVGVLGQNNAESGTPIGVQGAVPSSKSGYGLQTPDDARVLGSMSTDGSGWTVEVAGTRALFLGAEVSGDAGEVVAGNAANEVKDGAVGAVVSGGGNGSSPNAVTDDYGTVGGGRGNTAGSDADDDPSSARYATVGGGIANVASNDSAVVAGGRDNDATGKESTVGGGSFNEATAEEATVAGGGSNVAGGSRSVIGGGDSNATSGTANTIAGGNSNQTDRNAATVGGGAQNRAVDDNATVPGGRNNTASGNGAFAAGFGAAATDNGSFVWSDGTTTATCASQFPSSGSDTFNVSCVGGARFVTGFDGSCTPDTGVTLATGGGSWGSISSRKVKEDVRPVDPEAVLGAVEDLSVNRWRYRSQEGVDHMGPMAEDFHEAFGLGADERHITSVDADGVAIAAIQGLSQALEEARAELDAKDQRIEELETRLDRIENRLDDPDSAHNSTAPADD